MRLAVFPIALAALCVALPGASVHPAAAQTPDSQTARALGRDPLERETPRGTVAGFTHAVRRGDFVVAQAYMQLNPRQQSSAESLARNLAALLDRYYTQPVTELSDRPEGVTADGLPLDREGIGLSLPDTGFDVGLVRIPDAEGRFVWLFSSETLAQMPPVSLAETRTWVERTMPASLLTHSFLGISPAHWIVLAASIALPLLFFVLLVASLVRLARRGIHDPARRALLDAWYDGLGWPLLILLTLLVHLLLMRVLGFPLTFRFAWAHFAIAAAVIVAAWLVLRLLTLGFQYARLAALRRADSGTRSLLLLGERMVKVIVVLMAIFALLTIVGVDTTTALAGVGIGGIAVALGAQRTVENLLGGIFLLTDRALAVGDYCRISDREGWVEDITLRSVRLRTLEQTLLSVPAGAVAVVGVENFTSRSKILAKTTLRLRYGTTERQLRAILDGIRGLLAAHPRLETEESRVRLVDFGAQAIELELFAYVLTADLREFLAVREDLLLQIAGLVESSGSAFAQPTEFLYVSQDGSGSAPAAASAERVTR
jgi:MscS family membrane protein